MIKKAIIPVAGLGTRMLPATKVIPKEMLTVVDRPLILYIVEEAVMAGIKQIVFIDHHSKNSIGNHFDKCFELDNWHDDERGCEVKLKNGSSIYLSEGTYILVEDYCPICGE